MKIRLRSDVPIAFCLSGGIDSSTLVSIAKKNGVDVKTFSIIDSDERYNESENINLLVDFRGEVVINQALDLKLYHYFLQNNASLLLTYHHTVF